ncbi:MAG: DUF2059 domain-containing protein [Burkholderiaceae bacterium]
MNSLSHLIGALVAVALAVAVHPASAQGAAPAPAAPAKKDSAPVSAAKKELVRKALQLQQPGIESVGTGMANQAAGQVMQLAGPGIARAPEEKRRALVAELQGEVRKFQGEVAPILRASATKWAPSTLGTTLEEKFSEEELKVLIAWLESPVSRKYQEVTPEAQQALSQKIVTETRAQIEPKLKALEQAMIARINASSAPAAGSSAPAQPAKK